MHIKIIEETDIAKVVQDVMIAASEIGFNKTKQFIIATAASELARNIFVYARKGDIYIKDLNVNGRKGLEIIAEDQGPGIANVKLALEDNYSTTESLGIGLPGTKRLMDEFKIESEVGKGTRINIKKWLDL
ncbi:MAG: anti-sigma regulatory factor [Flavobacteriales bacterium]|nr:anti-sigma regulatory factor [Flavobacteriales bacterium]